MLSCIRAIECYWGNLPSVLAYFKGWNNLCKSYGHFASTFWALEAHWQFWNGCWAIDKPYCVWPTILFFKLTMQNHAQTTILPPHDCNPTTRLWAIFGTNGILNHWLSKWFKMAKIFTIMVLGNMEDECTFSNIFLHEIKIPKSFDYALGSHCADVCIDFLHLGNLPIFHNNVHLEG
jgi:hypothetical protein